MNSNIIKIQHAVELFGPGQLRVNESKPVPEPTGYQVLCKVEATGLCFSDLKLLKQFSTHARKGQVVSGMEKAIIDTIPSYVPDDKPTVPGHETVVRIVAIGDKVREHKVGERCLVQTDYRKLKTAGGSNAAFGYNFEGGLQEYVIVDERVSRDAETGERLLIPVAEENSASSICLVEPWACVEDSYANIERGTIKKGGNLLIVVDEEHQVKGINKSLSEEGLPSRITFICADKIQQAAIRRIFPNAKSADSPAVLPEQSFDDIIYFGVNRDMIIVLDKKLALGGLINIVTAGRKIGSPVPIGIGRVHYGMTRWVGTNTLNAADGYEYIPLIDEIEGGDNCLIVGAGGPMGQMHVIRNICSGIKDVSITATDFDDSRLESLRNKAGNLAQKNGVRFNIVNTLKQKLEGKFDYIAIMAPVPQLVSEAIVNSADYAIINIFAGIPASTIHEIDLDMLIEKHCFMFGTSGSVLRDIKIVLDKVNTGMLDTDISVDAISGIAGAIDGITAVENRTLSGKIIVYTQIQGLGLVPLCDLPSKLPNVAKKLHNGQWCKEAEDELLKNRL